MHPKRAYLSVWDFDENKPPTVHIWPLGLVPKSMCSSKDGSFIYAWCTDEHIRVWETRDGFILSSPIIELAVSPWPKEVKRALWLLGPVHISHNATVLQALIPMGNRHLCVVINLEDGSCMRATPFGDEQALNRTVLALTTNNRLHMLSPIDPSASLVPRLAQIPFHEGDDAAEWLETVNDAFATLQRALLQVWNLDTGEMEAIITWSRATVELDELPPTFALRHLHPVGNLDKTLVHNYSYHKAWLQLYSGSPLEHIGSLGITSDMRPIWSMSCELGIDTIISTFGSCVAIGSSSGTVNFFDFAQALKAAEARRRTESGAVK
jgi:hypothetical protein